MFVVDLQECSVRGYLSFCFATCMLAVLVLSRLAHAGDVAATPPMGWNSWNWFADKVTDRDIRAPVAITLVPTAMSDRMP
jgi:alpha-galactosidase